MCIEYELLDSGRGVGHQVNYLKLIFNKCECNYDCFIKYQTLDNIIISRYNFLPTQVFGHFEGNFSAIKLPVSIFGQTTGYSL